MNALKIDKRFNELMTFAASEAATALSDLLKKPMKVEVMDVSFASKGIQNEVANLSPSNGGAIIMATTLVGMVDGVGTFILPTPSALRLCDALLRTQKGDTKHLGEMEQSALLEAGNIVIGCFLNALGYVSNLNNILHKKLSITISPNGKLPDFKYPNHSDELIVRASFHMRHINPDGYQDGIDIDGLCAFFFSPTSVFAKI